MLEQSAWLTDAFAGPLPALHAISLYTTLSTRRTISETLRGTGANNAGLGSRSTGSAVKNNSAPEGQAIKLGVLTFKRGKSVGGASEAVAPTHALPSEHQRLPSLQVNVQQERSVSFDARSESDEKHGEEKNRL
jgi:hypothetical protein